MFHAFPSNLPPSVNPIMPPSERSKEALMCEEFNSDGQIGFASPFKTGAAQLKCQGWTAPSVAVATQLLFSPRW